MKYFSLFYLLPWDYFCIQGEVGLPGPPGLDGEKVKQHFTAFSIKKRFSCFFGGQGIFIKVD